MLLYTERAHFFFRLAIRGASVVIFYGLPDHKEFYNEVLSGLGELKGSAAAG